jgi:hypothetical protein
MKLVGDSTNLEAEKHLHNMELERNKILHGFEEQWRLHSRAIWIHSGDQNTKFFHNYANHSRIRKHVWEITDENGYTHSGQGDIKEEVVQYFKKKFKAPIIPSTTEQVKVTGLYSRMVNDEESSSLYRPVTMEELKTVLSLFKKDKIPGHDGWTVEFFTYFFDLVGEDLLDMVEESRLRGSIAGSLNSTFLTLIPKANKPVTFEDFCPISLCNLCYKLISKIIANRIKPILSRSLSAEQLVFLQGRQIQDAIGTTHESLHSIKRKKLKSLVLKLDLRKAYDCIDWDFLRMTLLQVGFGLQMTKWIMSCVNSSSYAFLLNGEATDFFRSGRGLRQGCPLSPLLFILVMEGLNLLLKESKGEGNLTGIKVSRMIKILHLLFVDNVLIMTKATLKEWLEIDKIIKLFCKASGLQVNDSKTTVHFEGLSDADLITFKSFLPYTFTDLSFSFKYLGYFLKTGVYRAGDWNWLVTKMEKKIGLWCNRWLSLGARYILLKSVLESQPVYWMSLETIPRSVLNKIQITYVQFPLEWSQRNSTTSSLQVGSSF